MGGRETLGPENSFLLWNSLKLSGNLYLKPDRYQQQKMHEEMAGRPGLAMPRLGTINHASPVPEHPPRELVGFSFRDYCGGFRRDLVGSSVPEYSIV